MGAVDMLLEHDPKQVKVVDKDGNGLLHHAKGKQVSGLAGLFDVSISNSINLLS